MKHHPQPKEPRSFLQGEELTLLSSYVSSYMGALQTGSVQLESTATKYIHGGQGPAILLLHGIGSKKSHFRSTMKALISSGFRVIAPDVPGIYPSVRLSSGKHNFRNLSLWLKAFTDALGLRQYTLLGNSVSASLAAYHGAHYADDVSNLILLSMPATFNEKGEDLKTIFMELLPHCRHIEDVDRLLSECFYVPPQLPVVVKKLIVSDILNNQVFIRQLLDDIRESQVQLSSKIKQISVPTLLISGEEDAVCTPAFSQWLASQILRADLHIIAKSKHLTFIERHRLVVKLIQDFLKENTSREKTA